MKVNKFIWLSAVVLNIGFAAVALSFDPSVDKLVEQPDGLHKAALASGGTYRAGGRTPPKYRMNSLEALVKASPTIVVATVSNATPELQNQGRFLRTNCKLTIIETIKGDFVPTDFLEMPGGTYTFSDGSVIDWVEPVWKKLRSGTTYVLFLRRWEDEPDHFHVVSAGQGIFEISPDKEHLISYTYIPYPYDPLIDEANAGRDAFLKKVRSIVTATRLDTLR
jgi:hypothetical protein